MLRRITQVWRNPEHRTVLANTASLSGLQVANTVLPLVTIPYVVRVVGPANYGAIAFAQAFATYFVLFVNYGFSLSASREIARVRDNPVLLAEVFWGVIWTKVALFSVSTVCFVVFVYLSPELHSQWHLMAASYMVIIGYVMFPTWFFQGIEKLGVSAVFNFLVKLVFTAGIFIFLKTRENFILVPSLTSAGQVMVGSIALMFVVLGSLRTVKPPNPTLIIRQLREGWAVFVSVVFNNLYTLSNVVILGFFASQSSVGYFSAAAKIMGAIWALIIMPFGQATYPFLGRVLKQDRQRGISYLRKTGLLMLLVTVPASAAIYMLASPIVREVLGAEFQPAVLLVKIMSPFPLLFGLNNLLGMQCLLNLDHDKDYLKVIIGGSALDLGLNLILASRYKEIGATISWLATEVFVVGGFFLAAQKAGTNLLDVRFYKKWLWQ